jgi:hypothetical protein
MKTSVAVISVLVLLLSPGAAQTSAPQRKNPPAGTTLCGPPTSESLKCPRFGFIYRIPFGWVDRTSDMGEQPDAQHSNSAQSETLLAIFERPPAAPGETINSAVVFAAEPLANYRGVKQASDYFGPITELAEQRGFKAEGDPYAVTIGARQLVRGDFAKPRGNLTMYQSSLAFIEKGYIVSFTFLAGSEDETDELIARLTFAARATGHK